MAACGAMNFLIILCLLFCHYDQCDYILGMMAYLGFRGLNHVLSMLFE